jgi:hypothetical protein
MVRLEQLLRGENSDANSLDFASSRDDKIRKIEGLTRFNRLKSLNLANNMISII